MAAEEPGNVRDEWKSWRLDTLPIVLERIPVTYGTSRSGQSHKPKVEAIKQALQGVERVIIATDPGREGSMIAWEVLEHLGYRGRVDRLKLGALDEVSIRRAFAAMAKESDSGERDYAGSCIPTSENAPSTHSGEYGQEERSWLSVHSPQGSD